MDRVPYHKQSHKTLTIWFAMLQQLVSLPFLKLVKVQQNIFNQ